ncbi:MAG: hypothetical protein ACD_49C00067G0009 [uncultured bacterium (gcode 4)]|uniref:Uncharacterized protein n=1 Tax=uncultured bacterium (gcode 4) TaxID=1234023 RepID=K2BB87_9BACT|nr:MAG: hypothetical protein ACD_49C00067G0009 [uncultured bacterium (gcode 4)]
MNTLENFEQERKTCSNIYEILAHPAIFKSLISCIFQDIEADEYQHIYNIKKQFLWNRNNKEYREEFLRYEENISKILEFFKDETNVKKFANEVDKFYTEHKEALYKSWINHSHKNAYSIAIATLRQFEDDKFVDNSEVDNHTSIKPTQKDDIVKRVNDKFEEILSEIRPDYLIVWDIEWNLVNWVNSNYIIDFFDKNVAQIKNNYIDIDTRKPIIIDDCNLYWMSNIYLPGWKNIVEVELSRNSKTAGFITKYMLNKTEEYSVEWNKIVSIWDRDNLPNWDEVAKIVLENEDTRYVTKENKIYRVHFEGSECEVCDLWEMKEISKWKNARQAIIIDKNWKKRKILILEYWIQKPMFTIFWKAFFKFSS